jgi:hypothetical protein
MLSEADYHEVTTYTTQQIELSNGPLIEVAQNLLTVTHLILNVTINMLTIGSKKVDS